LDDLDVQKRLDVRLLAPSESETGWDVFILDYNIDGPIGTVKHIKLRHIVAKFINSLIFSLSNISYSLYLDLRAM
jgi:gamma-tubulin complex component 3